MKISTNKALSVGVCLCLGIMLPFAVTSCGAAKTYYSPLKIGSNTLDDSPWKNVLNSQSIWSDLSDQVVMPTPAKINDYVPSHYVVNTNKSAAFAWCQPDKVDDTGVAPSTYDWNLPLLNFTSPSNPNKIVSYRNTNLTASINSTVNTARILNSYYSVLLNYITQPAISFNTNHSLTESWMNALLGDFNFNDQKTEFYNFAFSNINTLAETGKPFQFSSDKVDFDYASSIFGPGPLLSSNLSGITFKDDSNSTTIDTSIPLVDLFMSNAKINTILQNDYYGGVQNKKVYIGQGTSNELVPQGVLTALGDGQYPVGGIGSYSSSAPGFSSPYVNYVEDPTSHKISNVYFSQVPVLIKTNSVDYAFYNFKKDAGFNPNQWILPTSEVNAAIKKSSSWKNYSKFTSTTPELTSNICTVSTKPYAMNTAAWIPNTGKIMEHDTPGQEYLVDPALTNILGTNTVPSQNDFIGFANYGCTVDTDSSGNTHLYPYCAGISSAYPIMLFQKTSDFSTFTLDRSLFSFNENSDLSTGYGSLRQYNAKIDFRKLDTKLQTTFFRFFQKFVDKNLDPTTLDNDDKYALLFSKSLLSNWDQETTPSTFLNWN